MFCQTICRSAMDQHVVDDLELCTRGHVHCVSVGERRRVIRSAARDQYQ